MAKDIYHETVKMALIKDGWTITNDPLSLAVGGRMVYVDLGAEKLLAAEKDNQRIAVEIKSFVRPSPVQDLENALGQYVLYRGLMQESPLHQDRKLYSSFRCYVGHLDPPKSPLKRGTFLFPPF
ncbi:element excision factor XisH family protein [Roseofilum capinflatum]|uniref:Element excision factor XisH family protein n=1 Tax=Roseofilum capinflatum BLCC-M114 TaxID=3022440 RepID=A0ABT7B708_9CYAN|nr:element excision factor XisH family protein [Roseofilum capinflatum]MDJ1174622.1 element excision factor XisH family protein [Roseofilum capinflatum BLCC-M114]